MSYQKLVCLEDDLCDGDSKTTVFKKSHTNSFRKRFKSVIHQSSLNSNYRCAKVSHSLPNSPKKNTVSFFRVNARQKGDSTEKLQEYFHEGDEGDEEEPKG